MNKINQKWLDQFASQYTSTFKVETISGYVKPEVYYVDYDGLKSIPNTVDVRTIAVSAVKPTLSTPTKRKYIKYGE